MNRVRVFPRAGYASRLVGAQIQGSNVDATSGFVNLGTIKKAPAEGKWTQYTLRNTKSYKYVRLFTPASSWGNVAELEFYNGNTKLNGQPYGTFGSRDNSGNTYEKAFDGDTKTYYDAPAPNSQYLGIVLDSGDSANANNTPGTNTPISGKARRHYHIGNSLTDTIGEFMQATAIAAGYKDDFFDRQTIPGSPLSYNWQSKGGFGTPYREAFVQDAPLTDLVMQAFIDNGDSQNPEFSLQFYDLAKQTNPAIKPWIYGQWPVTGTGGNTAGSPDWEERTRVYMRTYITHALNFRNERPNSGIEVVPGGLALINLKKAYEAGKIPGYKGRDFFPINFDDDLHVSGEGRYFIGLVNYAAIYNQSPVGVPWAGFGDFKKELSPEQVRAYQQVAWDTVSQFKKSGGRELGYSLPATIDARDAVRAMPPFNDPFVLFIPENARYDYLLNASKAGKYDLRVNIKAGSPGRKLNVLLNHQAAGALEAPASTDDTFQKTAALTLDLKAGLNLLQLHVPENRPYDINTLDIAPTGGPALKNTLPTVNFWVYQPEISAGEKFTKEFTVFDDETKAGDLKVVASSSDTALVPNANLKLETLPPTQNPQVSTRRLTVTPAAGKTGSTKITVTVQDAGGLTRSVTFSLKVK